LFPALSRDLHYPGRSLRQEIHLLLSSPVIPD
jgi:hypothetical protein